MSHLQRAALGIYARWRQLVGFVATEWRGWPQTPVRSSVRLLAVIGALVLGALAAVYVLFLLLSFALRVVVGILVLALVLRFLARRKQDRSGWETDQSPHTAETAWWPDIDTMTGVAFQHFVGRILERLGHEVTYNQASRDFGADLVAGIYGVRTVVQAKRRSPTDTLSVGAVQEVVASKAMYGASRAWVVCNCSFTQAAVALADANDVTLVDRPALLAMMRRASQ